MAKDIAGLDKNAVLIPAAVNILDADGTWDRSDPPASYVAQERPTSVAKSYSWDNLKGKTTQMVVVEDGRTKVYPPEKVAGITSPTYPRARWANGEYVYEIPE